MNTVEKLVTECGFPARAVERAILICSKFASSEKLVVYTRFGG